MRDNAAAKGQEFFLFDTGDLIEGTGLSDATPIHGQYIFPVAQNVDYDGLTIGNHDIGLYGKLLRSILIVPVGVTGHADTVSLMESTFIPFMGKKYITSNSFTPQQQPLGSAYTVITTALGTGSLSACMRSQLSTHRPFVQGTVCWCSATFSTSRRTRTTR
jgi:hypothetical protein